MTDKKQPEKAKAAPKAAPKATAKAEAPKSAAPKAMPKAKPAAAPAKAKPAASGATLKLIQTGSPIGRQKDQRATLIGLRLNKINRRSELQDTPEVRGMINKVKHLVKVEG